ncbi:EspA/EspE family type VII secretion system effector [Mycolicibacterium sp. 050232]|uniref:EspA/EspE family type VII secretion system effector n=1 Tax=Mycolicibacterium sp. 050232 TaxID=3113982 RepID=UPI002E2E4FD9|nr:EspA/EspE family type VII secretion system effector [Mycolicibacterium sp. 050232]MED5811113.1 EspA/EspE family type VII secretion system effector [Mycolicibacterium sp. 050232]
MSFWSAAEKVSDTLGNSKVAGDLGDANTLWSTKSHDDAGDKLGLGSDAIAIVQMFLGKSFATPIINVGLLGIQGMTLTCGIGSPDTGDRFGQGAEQLGQVHDTLESAKPTSGWQGGASQAYTGQDAKQQERARSIAEADKALEAIVSKQASQVDQTRSFLGTCATVLGYAILPAMIAKVSGPQGPAVALAIEMGAVAGSVPLAAGRMSMMNANAAANAVEVSQVIGKYTKVAASATFGK